MNTLSYQKCYEILALPNHAEWEQANASFRLQVQKWHPDRYDGDEPEEATQRYVEVTKAFKKLRNYHKENGVMPFSSVETVDEPEAVKPSFDVAEITGTRQNKTAAPVEGEIGSQGNGLGTPQSEEIRSRGDSTAANSNWNTRQKFRPSRFAMSIAAVLVVGISMLLLFMTKLDRISSDHYRDEARMQRINEQLAEQPDSYQ